MYKWYGNMAMDFLRDNPYILTDENLGVEFRLADQIAAELGFTPDSPVRAEAGILYELEYNTQNGHVFIPAQKLVAAAAGLLGVDESICGEALNRLVDKHKVVFENIAVESACYLFRLYEAEREIAQRLLDMAAIPPSKVDGIGIDDRPDQRRAWQ